MAKLKLIRLNQRSFVKKWLLMMVQGVLLFLLGIAFLSQPENPLVGFQMMVSLAAIINGAIFVFGYFFADPFDKSQAELILGIILFAVSLLVLFNGSQDQYRESIFLSGFMLANGFFYAVVSWNLRSEIKFWWITMLLPVYTVFLVFFILASLAQTTLLNHFGVGLQFLWCGIAVLKISLVTRSIEAEFKKPINRIRVK